MQAFVDGINARDTEILEHVATNGYADSVIETWFDTYLTYAQIGESHEVAGETAVAVSFIPEGGDDSLPDDGSRITWSITLKQQDGEWVVTGMGQG